MLRVSWPLAILLFAFVAIVARRPRLFPYVIAILAIWFVVELVQRRRRR